MNKTLPEDHRCSYSQGLKERSVPWPGATMNDCSRGSKISPSQNDCPLHKDEFYPIGQSSTRFW